ncbi:MAG: hypothetical protein J7L73_09590, partial [Anaerolineales bacterium]|nr:hypothetical protein [Anaerolineales bacterium]
STVDIVVGRSITGVSVGFDHSVKGIPVADDCSIKLNNTPPIEAVLIHKQHKIKTNNKMRIIISFLFNIPSPVVNTYGWDIIPYEQTGFEALRAFGIDTLNCSLCGIQQIT